MISLTISKKKNKMIKKIIEHPIIKVVISSVVIILSVALFKEAISKPALAFLGTPEHLNRIIGSSISLIVMLAAYYLLIRFYLKRPFNDFPKNKVIPELGGGILMGFSAIGIVILALFLLGYYQVTGSNNFYSFVPTITYIIGGVMLEEIIFRGLLFKALETIKGTIFAVIISSIIFQIPHFMNPHEAFLPALLGFLFGVLHALIYANTKNLWLPIAFHMGWNIAQPFFGTTLSGIDGFNNLLIARTEGPQLITGSAFGIEDSLLSLMVLVSLSFHYYMKLKRRGAIIRYRKD